MTAAATLSADGLSATIALRADPGTSRVRFLAFGTGTTPMLGTDGVPLAGRTGGPGGSADDGHDYVQMFA
jgi:hypothetical protein